MDIISRDEELEKAIRQRDLKTIVSLMFEGNPPELKPGFKTETELWDYKKDCPKGNLEHWADIAKSALGFYNNRGGLLIFGITDDLSFNGVTSLLDSKRFNDQIRKFLSDRIWIEFHREFIQGDQRYLGIAIISPRGPEMESFTSDAPIIGNKPLFKKGESALREGDSTKILSLIEIQERQRAFLTPRINQIYEVNKPFFRVLSQDSQIFVKRDELCDAILKSINDPRVAVTSLIGIGGAGKTALATWATQEVYKLREFDFIASITAKDRELTGTGITALKPGLTSFETLLDGILEVLEFHEYKYFETEEKAAKVREIITETNGLLMVDNLETVDDVRIIDFLDNLPLGMRAITTSRRSRVKVAARPIEVGPLTEKEVIKLIRAISKEPGFSYILDFTDAECLRIGDACDRFPLGIKWVLSKSKSPAEALSEAESITQSGRRGEELLEFCFRRIFDSMPGEEKVVLQVLSLFHSPRPLEALMVATGLPQHTLNDVMDHLVEDALAQRVFDSILNTYSYSLLPVTRAFVLSQVHQQPGLADKFQRRLSDYYEAKDITDAKERIVIREFRQGKEGSEMTMVDLAGAAAKRGDLKNAEELYNEAISRNPNSWRALKAFADFCRNTKENKVQALELCEKAARYAPIRGADRAKIYREWGMLLKDSGAPNSTQLAIEKFNEALKDSPNDPFTIHPLAVMYKREGNLKRVIELLEPLAEHENQKTRDITLPILLESYEKTGDIVKAAGVRNKLKDGY